jgi:hypothetical protein
MGLKLPAIIVAGGLLFLIGAAAFVVHQGAREERVEQLAKDWSNADFVPALVTCRTSGELWMGVPCDEILDAWQLQNRSAAGTKTTPKANKGRR